MTGPVDMLEVLCRGSSDNDASHNGRVEKITQLQRDFSGLSMVNPLSTAPLRIDANGKQYRKKSKTIERQEIDGEIRLRMKCPLCKFTLTRKDDDRFRSRIITLLDNGVAEITLSGLAAILTK